MKVTDTERCMANVGPAWAKKSTSTESVTPTPITPKMVDSGWMKSAFPDFRVGQEQAEVHVTQVRTYGTNPPNPADSSSYINGWSGLILVMLMSILGSAWRFVVNQVRCMERPNLSTVSTSHVIGGKIRPVVGAFGRKKARKGQQNLDPLMFGSE